MKGVFKLEKYEDLFMPSFLSGNDNNEPLKPFPKDTSLAMAYIPFQQDINPYSPEKALNKGTFFKDLNKPFLGRKEAKNE